MGIQVHCSPTTNRMRCTEIIFSLLLLTVSIRSSPNPESLMRDPAFLSCLQRATGGDPSQIQAAMGGCMGFVGRPRFGKRRVEYLPLSEILPYSLPYSEME